MVLPEALAEQSEQICFSYIITFVLTGATRGVGTEVGTAAS
jgi:hypothetical protein